MAELNLSKRYDFAETREVQYDDDGEIFLEIAPLSNREFQEHIAKFERRVQAQTGGARRSRRHQAEIEEERAENIREGVARYIIRDWSGVEDEKGREVPYTWEEGLKQLQHPERGESFFDDVYRDAKDFDAFRRAQQEKSEKNSPALSGSSELSESAQTASGVRRPTAISSAAS